MPLAFLAPLFLAGLIGVAIPVLIHLTQRERRRALDFPSLMFLRRIPHRSVRRRRIRHWLLLVLRASAIILLAGAFARPLLERTGGAGPLATAREIAILLDRSYSMDYGDRWDRALSAARAVVAGMGDADRATIVLFDAGAAAANQATGDKTHLLAVLDSARVGSGTTRYGPALKLAQSLLEATDRPRRQVVLISDFQRTGWEGDPGVRLPPGTQLQTVALGDSVVADVSVTTVSFRREYVAGKERVVATARIANRSAQPVSGVPVTLEIDGREMQRKSVAVDANGAATVSFDPFALAEANTRGVVRVRPDALPRDDAFYFVLSPGQAIPVLVVTGRNTPNAGLYVQRALAIGQQPGFRVTRRSGALRAADLTGAGVVILDDAPAPGGATLDRLRTFVAQGGGLVVALGERGGASWAGAAGDLLPGRVEPVTDRADHAGATLGQIEYSHPIFEVFRAPHSGDFGAARFFRYHPLEPRDSAHVLARFDDGAAALVEGRLGAGHVLAWGSTLDTYWTDLPLQPVFLPFMHRLVQYASGYREPRPWFTAGQALDIARLDTLPTGATPAPGTAATPRELIATTPAGAQVTIAARTGALRLDEQGFYQVREARGRGGDILTVAVNLDLTEADLTPMNPEELVSAVAAAPITADEADPAQTIPAAERERQQSLWWYLLIVVFLLLAAETIVSNRLSPAVRRS